MSVKAVLLLVLVVIVLSDGLERVNIKKENLKALLASKTKADKTHRVTHQKTHELAHHKAHHKAHEKTKWFMVDPTISSWMAARLINWFYDWNIYIDEDAQLPEECVDLALCMLTNVQWGSHVMNYVPQNYPTSPGKIRSELKAIFERVTDDTSIYQSVKSSVARAHRSAAELCEIHMTHYEVDVFNTCRSLKCSKIFGHPAIKSPIGDAYTTNTFLGCDDDDECARDSVCKRFGGTAICEHFRWSSNKCRCMWILPDEYASRLCGKDSVDELSTFDCAGSCGGYREPEEVTEW
jgi:hypothetical protein